MKPGDVSIIEDQYGNMLEVNSLGEMRPSVTNSYMDELARLRGTMWECMSEVQMSDGKLVLTEAQRELALNTAKLKLLDDPEIKARLHILQAAELAEVEKMLRLLHRL